MAKVSITYVGIYDAQVYVSGFAEDSQVRIYVREGKKSGTGSVVYDESFTVFGTFKRVDLDDLDPETWYTANASLDGGATWIGAVEFQTDPEKIEWPGDWGWWSEKIAGQPVKIRANEWMHFTERINEIRAYAGAGEFEFTYVEPGDPISATVCMEAYAAIYEIADPDDMPEAPFKGFPMKASFFNDLRDALNAVE